LVGEGVPTKTVAIAVDADIDLLAITFPDSVWVKSSFDTAVVFDFWASGAVKPKVDENLS
jgi:hypothetical protein